MRVNHVLLIGYLELYEKKYHPYDETAKFSNYTKDRPRVAIQNIINVIKQELETIPYAALDEKSEFERWLKLSNDLLLKAAQAKKVGWGLSSEGSKSAETFYALRMLIINEIRVVFKHLFDEKLSNILKALDKSLKSEKDCWSGEVSDDVSVHNNVSMQIECEYAMLSCNFEYLNRVRDKYKMLSEFPLPKREEFISRYKSLGKEIKKGQVVDVWPNTAIPPELQPRYPQMHFQHIFQSLKDVSISYEEFVRKHTEAFMKLLQEEKVQQQKDLLAYKEQQKVSQENNLSHAADGSEQANHLEQEKQQNLAFSDIKPLNVNSEQNNEDNHSEESEDEVEAKHSALPKSPSTTALMNQTLSSAAATQSPAQARKPTLVDVKPALGREISQSSSLSAVGGTLTSSFANASNSSSQMDQTAAASISSNKLKTR